MDAYKITEADQLNLLLTLTRKLPFVLAFKELSERRNKEWADRIRKNYYACGCNMGMHFMMSTVFLILLIVATNQFFIHKPIHYFLFFYALIAIFLMAGLGKMIGKAKARAQLKTDVKNLKELLMKGEDSQKACKASAELGGF